MNDTEEISKSEDNRRNNNSGNSKESRPSNFSDVSVLSFYGQRNIPSFEQFQIYPSYKSSDNQQILAAYLHAAVKYSNV
jgi:hypothetical protein